MTPPAESESSPHLNVAELAVRWKTTKTAIYIARHRGKAPNGFKSGRNVLFPLSAVEAFEAERMAGDKPSHRGTTTEHRPAERTSRRGHSTRARA
ncbi:helix-turn-helix transcriptional regulator [Streptomyces sp. NPDC055210]